jgi:hypothetical protein
MPVLPAPTHAHTLRRAKKKRTRRSNAVRVLCQIVDTQLLAQIERYLKQAVVDKSPVVAASVLVSALHLMHSVSDGWWRVGCGPWHAAAVGKPPAPMAAGTHTHTA